MKREYGVVQFTHLRRKWEESGGALKREKWWVDISNASYGQSPNNMQWCSTEYLVMHNEEIGLQSFRLESLMAKLPDVLVIRHPIPNGDFLLKPRKNTGYNLVSFVLISS